MYSIFTEWQKRSAAPSSSTKSTSTASAESAAAASKYQPKKSTTATTADESEGQENSTKVVAPTPQVLRPIDMFYAKLIPVLKSMNIGNVMNRADWPAEALKKVFHELERECPKDLLERELWCAAPTTADWWAKTQQFARSNAVMSMVGYVIGLGDRHLDNILLDFSTGEVIHIDYSS